MITGKSTHNRGPSGMITGKSTHNRGPSGMITGKRTHNRGPSGMITGKRTSQLQASVGLTNEDALHDPLQRVISEHCRSLLDRSVDRTTIANDESNGIESYISCVNILQQ